MDFVINKIYWQQLTFEFMAVSNISTHKNHLIMMLKYFYGSIELIVVRVCNVGTFRKFSENALHFSFEHNHLQHFYAAASFLHICYQHNSLTPDAIVALIFA